MFGLAYGVITEFAVLLTLFLALSAAPLERIRLQRILSLIMGTALVLLAILFGLLPYYAHGTPVSLALLLASGLAIGVAAVLEVWVLAILVTDWSRTTGATGS